MPEEKGIEAAIRLSQSLFHQGEDSDPAGTESVSAAELRRHNPFFIRARIQT